MDKYCLWCIFDQLAITLLALIQFLHHRFALGYVPENPQGHHRLSVREVAVDVPLEHHHPSVLGGKLDLNPRNDLSAHDLLEQEGAVALAGRAYDIENLE